MTCTRSGSVQFQARICAFVRQFAPVFILSLALVVFRAFSMASRQTNNSMDAAFSALNVSLAPSSVTSTSIVSMSLPNLSCFCTIRWQFIHGQSGFEHCSCPRNCGFGIPDGSGCSTGLAISTVTSDREFRSLFCC